MFRKYIEAQRHYPKWQSRDLNLGSLTPASTLRTTSAHIILSPQFRRGHQSSCLSVLDWRNNKQCVFSPLRINLGGGSPGNDSLGEALLTRHKPTFQWEDGSVASGGDEWVGYWMWAERCLSDSSHLVNLLPASSPCKVLTPLHFNEKPDLGHDLVGFLTHVFQRCACKTELLLMLEV